MTWAEADETARARLSMVEGQLGARGIRDRRVLNAMRSVPREHFIPTDRRHLAYEDGALPIGHGQTISQPYMVARSCQLAAIGPDDRVLEVGAGSGYQAAVLGQLAREVFALEIVPELSARARDSIAALGYHNVRVLQGDGSLGHPPEAPFDAIVVAAGSPLTPPALLEQLAEGGRLVIPVGSQAVQCLTLHHKTRGGVRRSLHDACVFVPLTGQAGEPLN